MSALGEALAAWDAHGEALEGVRTERELLEWELFRDHHAKRVADAFCGDMPAGVRREQDHAAIRFAVTTKDGRAWLERSAADERAA